MSCLLACIIAAASQKSTSITFLIPPHSIWWQARQTDRQTTDWACASAMCGRGFTLTNPSLLPGCSPGRVFPFLIFSSLFFLTILVFGIRTLLNTHTHPLCSNNGLKKKQRQNFAYLIFQQLVWTHERCAHSSGEALAKKEWSRGSTESQKSSSSPSSFHRLLLLLLF